VGFDDLAEAAMIGVVLFIAMFVSYPLPGGDILTPVTAWTENGRVEVGIIDVKYAEPSNLELVWWVIQIPNPL
jgi:hypothetical protein